MVIKLVDVWELQYFQIAEYQLWNIQVQEWKNHVGNSQFFIYLKEEIM